MFFPFTALHLAKKKKKKNILIEIKKSVLSGNSRSASCQQILDKMQNEAEWKELESRRPGLYFNSVIQ